ncbi:MAG TPA: carboxymuconolactone decarboxylase family protein [Povalibacter sp.]|nr:carboxymuconolactone decarboxylase family protein [Povalibacter sp.]
MTARVNPLKYPKVYKAMLGLKEAVEGTLEPSLTHLIKARVSLINGCGYCIDMHTKDARALGETEQRLYLLSVWREAPIYSEREQAALAWAEAVTLLKNQEVADEVYEQARRVFSEEELVALTLCVVEINGWNRFAIPFRTVPGSYQPAGTAKTTSA